MPYFILPFLLLMALSIEACQPSPSSSASLLDQGTPQAIDPDQGHMDLISQECQGLFGSPSERTGLSNDQCQPQCQCGEKNWQPTPISDSQREKWLQYVHANPSTPLTDDPYQMSDSVDSSLSSSTVCALLKTQIDHYQTQTFMHPQQANEVNAVITHAGKCGLCSSLQDLSVYSRYPDLTQSVRECGLAGLRENEEVQVRCLQDLGFTAACASIWSYNITHTRTQCLSECLALLNASHHQETGELNACIQCDEDLSGPVFKALAGRTRRNSGLPTALCRPCNTVFQVDHQYDFGE